VVTSKTQFVFEGIGIFAVALLNPALQKSSFAAFFAEWLRDL